MEQIKAISPADGAEIEICAPYQKEFYTCTKYRKEKKIIRKIIRAKKEQGFFSLPSPAVFRWEPSQTIAELEISESADFSDSIKILSENGEAKVYNLKKNTEYFWRVDSGNIHNFFTDGIMPRWIFADGYCNIRDFGGETNKDGVKIKQGMIFRGPRLEKETPAEGINALHELEIRTDLDLRKEAIGKLTASPLGKKSNFILHPCYGYEEFLNDNPKNIKYLIEYFTDENLYPIYFHCHGGQDRTGTLAFMLGAVLGLDDETLIREYELTMMAFPDKKLTRSRKDKIRKYLKILKNRDKTKTLGENAVDFLRECGVSESDFSKIREIMLVSSHK